MVIVTALAICHFRVIELTELVTELTYLHTGKHVQISILLRMALHLRH